ncbi:MAG: Rieske (2Fe-2S) protein [Nocardioidaceae bacterium]
MTDRRHDDETSLATRRTVLRGAMVAGVAVPFLAACGGDSTSNGSSPSSTGSTSPPGGSTSPPDGGGSTGTDSAIARTGDVPEGGGLILEDPQIVITQPAAGEFKGFSSICTHQGCPVDNVTDGTINCACHGSMYSIKDGSVVGGPAPAPLPEQKIAVKGKSIALA